MHVRILPDFRLLKKSLKINQKLFVTECKLDEFCDNLKFNYETVFKGTPTNPKRDEIRSKKR